MGIWTNAGCQVRSGMMLNYVEMYNPIFACVQGLAVLSLGSQRRPALWPTMYQPHGSCVALWSFPRLPPLWGNSCSAVSTPTCRELFWWEWCSTLTPGGQSGKLLSQTHIREHYSAETAYYGLHIRPQQWGSHKGCGVRSYLPTAKPHKCQTGFRVPPAGLHANYLRHQDVCLRISFRQFEW